MAYSDNYINPYREPGPNFGLLETGAGRGDSAHTQVIQAPQVANENEKGLLEGLQSMQEAKRTNIEQQKANEDIKNSEDEMSVRHAELGMKQQMQPYDIAAKQGVIAEIQQHTKLFSLMTQGEATKNAISKIALDGDKMNMDERKQTIKDSMSLPAQQVVENKQKRGDWAGAAAIETAHWNTLKAKGTALQENAKGVTDAMALNVNTLNNISQLPKEQQPVAFKQKLPIIQRVDPDVGSVVNLDNPTPEEIENYHLGTVSGSQALHAMKASQNVAAKVQEAQAQARGMQPGATQEEKDTSTILAGNQNKENPVIQNAQQMTQLQQIIADPSKSPQEKQQAQMQLDNMSKLTNKASSDKAIGNTVMTSPQNLKDFVSLEGMDRNLANAHDTLQTVGAEFSRMPKDAFNPVTGQLNAKFIPQQQATTKELNTLVLQAPALFGLSGSSLRLGSVWNMIEKSKPSPGIWMSANKAMLGVLNHSLAIQAEKTWKGEAETMNAQAMSKVPQAVEESKQWFKDHPEPVKAYPKPDLTDFDKLFPGAAAELEKDYATIRNQPLKNPEDHDTSGITPEMAAAELARRQGK